MVDIPIDPIRSGRQPEETGRRKQHAPKGSSKRQRADATVSKAGSAALQDADESTGCLRILISRQDATNRLKAQLDEPSGKPVRGGTKPANISTYRELMDVVQKRDPELFSKLQSLDAKINKTTKAARGRFTRAKSKSKAENQLEQLQEEKVKAIREKTGEETKSARDLIENLKNLERQVKRKVTPASLMEQKTCAAETSKLIEAVEAPSEAEVKKIEQELKAVWDAADKKKAGWHNDVATQLADKRKEHGNSAAFDRALVALIGKQSEEIQDKNHRKEFANTFVKAAGESSLLRVAGLCGKKLGELLGTGKGSDISRENTLTSLLFSQILKSQCQETANQILFPDGDRKNRVLAFGTPLRPLQISALRESTKAAFRATKRELDRNPELRFVFGQIQAGVGAADSESKENAATSVFFLRWLTPELTELETGPDGKVKTPDEDSKGRTLAAKLLQKSLSGRLFQAQPDYEPLNKEILSSEDVKQEIARLRPVAANPLNVPEPKPPPRIRKK